MGKRVVFVLQTYNQAAFVGDAVRAALAQDFDGLEIFFSDDASTDATFGEIEAVLAGYAGPHAIRLNRNPERMGSVDHLAHIGALVGEDAFLILAHGDDVSMPDRTRVLVEAWRRTRAAMVSSDVRWLGRPDGQKPNDRPSRRIAAREIVDAGWMPEMLGAALAFESTILEKPRRLSSEFLGWGLDHVLPLRAAAGKGFYYVAKPLVGYRRHDGNMSNVITDRTGSRDAMDEGLLAYDIAIRHHQRADLLALARAARVDPRRWLLLRKLERKLVDEVGRWSMLRARLKAGGQSPTWVPADELKTRRIVWEAQF